MKKILLYASLVLVGVAMLVPFYWMFVLATRSTSEIFRFPPPFWFGDNLASNFANMLRTVNVFGSYLNSVIISTAYTFLVLLFCSMGGYAFAMYRFPGRDKLFGILLVTMMIPFMAGIVPWFIMMAKFKLINSYFALIVPGCANAFGIFWMRQYCQNNVPGSLIDAAKIDGCSEWLIFFRIIVPILPPAFAALGIMSFIGSWNDFMQPLLILRNSRLFTLPLLLRYLQGDPMRGADQGVLMLANTLAVLPLLIAFFAASKYFLSGLTAGAIKE